MKSCVIDACSGAGDTGTPLAPWGFRGYSYRANRVCNGLRYWTSEGYHAAGARREATLHEDSISESALRHSVA